MLSERQWDVAGMIWLFCGILTTLCCGVILAGLVVQTVTGEALKDFLGTTLITLLFQGGVVFWTALFLRKEKKTWGEIFGFGKLNQQAILLGLAGGLIVTPAAMGLEFLSEKIMQFLHLAPKTQALVESLQKSHFSLGQNIILALCIIGLAPLGEEILFRGLLYPLIKQAGYPRLALWGTAVFFGAFHFNLVTLLPLVVIGLVTTLLYERTDNLLASITAHATFNAINFIMLQVQS